jgi:acyl carrier protein
MQSILSELSELPRGARPCGSSARRRTRGVGGAPCAVHATFPGLVDTSGPGRRDAAPGAVPSADRFERDTVDILKRISRRPIEPTPASELLADLGFDSLQVLELVGELEDHFGIAVPLNDLTHIRTVAQVVDEVRGLMAAQDRQ